MQRGLSSTGLLPIAVIFSIYIKGRWSGMKAGHPKRTAHRGQTWGLIKAQPSQAQTGFEVRHIKSTGSKVRQRTDLHLTLQLEMVISRCSDDPCLTVRDGTTGGDTSPVCVSVCAWVLACECTNNPLMHWYKHQMHQLTCITRPEQGLDVTCIHTHSSVCRIQNQIKTTTIINPFCILCMATSNISWPQILEPL